MKRGVTHDAVLKLLISDPDRLEHGLVVLDSKLLLGEGVHVDLLARDVLGYPVVVLLSDADAREVVGRMVAIVTALEQGRHLLHRLYGGKGLDPGLRPRFVLLSKRFSDQVPGLLDVLGSLEIVALEYRIVAHADDRGMLDLAPFHRSGRVSLPQERGEPTSPAEEPASSAPHAVSGGSSPASVNGLNGTARARTTDALSGLDAPEPAKRLFLRARESICSLSGQVSERGEGGRITYHVDEGLLATITLDRQGFRVRIGDEPGDQHAVEDDSTFNESLNAIFNLYFDRFAAHS